MDDQTPKIASRRLRWARALIIAVTGAVLLSIWFGSPSDYPIVQPDAYENLTAAYNLGHHGVISTEDNPAVTTPEPSEYREPLPIAVLAGYITALQPVHGDKPLGDLMFGDNARLLKQSNIVWGVLLSFVVFCTIVRYTGSYAWAAFGTLTTHIGLAEEYNGLYTEVVGAAMLALTCAVAAAAVRKQTAGWTFATGLLFGAMTLTKAAFLYVSVVLIGCVAAWGLWRLVRARDASVLKSVALVSLGLALVVGPWMARNYVHFDEWSLSGRGGQVLLTRAVKNQMTPEEYRGAWFAYAPRPLRWAASKLTGFDKDDLADGGRLVRLMRHVSPHDRPAEAAGRPQDAVSYFAKVKAMRAELEMRDPEASSLEIDDALKQRALGMIKAAPLAHLAATPLFLWRGAPYVFAILLAGALYACARRRWWLLAYVAPAMGLVLFYAALTHFIPRYALPMLPVASVAFAVLGHMALNATRAWRTRRTSARSAALEACTLNNPRMSEAG